MKCIIIDDEPRARNLIENILKEEYGDLISMYQAGNLKNGVALIKQHQIQVV